MPPQENDLLSLLMGQGQTPVDPRALALMEALKGGFAPATQATGDPTSDFNTILDLLSPGQSQAILDQQQAGALGRLEGAGLDVDEQSDVVRQQFGLQLSPETEAKSQIDFLKLLPEFTKAGAQASEAQTKAGELRLGKKTQRDVNKRAIERNRNFEELNRIREKDIDKLSPKDKGDQFDLTSKLLWLGMDPLTGESIQVDPELRQRLGQLLMSNAATPGRAAVLGELARSGDEGEMAAAAQISGLPLEVFTNWYGGNARFRLEAQQVVQPGDELRGEGGPLSLQDLADQQQMRGFQEALDAIERQRESRGNQ